MRLLRWNDVGELSFTKDLIGDDPIPAFAYLSHTWEDEEVVYEDVLQGTGRDKRGYAKIRFCGERAKFDGLEYFWIDTCCIDKRNHMELQETINSMFRWCRMAARCYVCLSDVPCPGPDSDWKSAFKASRWFTRSWTLQELIAPASVEFFACATEYKRLGDRTSLREDITSITGIPIAALLGAPLSHFSIQERWSWGKNRRATRDEDHVYSMLGILEVYMTLNYGEGRGLAFQRVREEIKRRGNQDQEALEDPTADDPGRSSKRRKVDQLNLFDRDDDLHAPDPVWPSKKDLLSVLQFDEIDDRLHNIRRSHTGTCGWLLRSKEYLEWQDPEKLAQHNGFFWIRGKPGCGKSTLAKFALGQMRSSLPDANLLSFFFNARGGNLERTTIGLYRSLLFQLLEPCDDEQVQRILKLNGWQIDDNIKTNQELLKELFAGVIRHDGQRRTVLIIDALDECGEDDARDMIEFLEDLGEDAVSNGRTFHALFTSRHYPHLEIARSVRMTLETQDGHSKDIEAYLASEIHAGLGTQTQQIRHEIRDRASGIFIWVVLVANILQRLFDRGQVHSLRKKLEEIPTDLHYLFREILTRDQNNLDAMKLCLQWLMFSKRPLKLEELYFAILPSLDPGESLHRWPSDKITTEDMNLFILSSSKGLAEITKKGTVQFIHESVRNFLVKDNSLGKNWSDLESDVSGLSHNRLKKSCIDYLRPEFLSRLDGFKELPSASSVEAEKLRRDASREFPFLDYAVHNLLVHAEASQARGIDQEGFVKDFELETWIRFNNLFERFQARRLPENTDLLYVLAERNCPNLVDLLIKNNPFDRPQWRQTKGRYRNPVFAAIATNNSQVFEALVKYDSQMHPDNCEVPYTSEEVCSFLVKYGKEELICRFLSVYKMDVSSALHGGQTMLIWAAKQSFVKLARLLLNAGVDLNAMEGRVLQEASRTENEELVKMLLDSGADARLAGPNGDSALQIASAKGNELIVKWLVDAGADVNQVGPSGTALHVACEGRDQALVKLLLDAEADVNVSGGEHGSVLQAAATVTGNEEVVKLLLDAGADVNAQGGRYGGALQAASSVSGNEEVVKLLLQVGADVDAQGGKYGSALVAASAREDSEATVKLLLDHGANVNAKTIQGGEFITALQTASQIGNKQVVRILIDAGASVGVQAARAHWVASSRGISLESTVDETVWRTSILGSTMDPEGFGQQSSLPTSHLPPLHKEPVQLQDNKQDASKITDGNPPYAEEDGCSDQSSAINLSQPERHRLITVFSDALLRGLRERYPIWQDNPSSVPLHQRCQDLLKDFAVEAKREAETGPSRQASKAIRALRLHISRKCEELLQGGGDDQLQRPRPKVPLQAKDSLPPTVNSLVHGWRGSLQHAEHSIEAEADPKHQEADREASNGSPPSTDSVGGDPRDSIPEGQEREVFDYLIAHPAFPLLVGQLERVVERYYVNMMLLIQKRITLSLKRKEESSRCRELPQRHSSEASFRFDLDIPAFLREQYGSTSQKFGHVITITGRPKNAQMLTVAEYLIDHWPDYPAVLLDAIQQCLDLNTKQSTSVNVGESGEVTVDLFEQRVLAKGPHNLIVAIGQQLSWLCTACRGNQDTLCHANCTFTELVEYDSPTFQIQTEILEVDPKEARACWCDFLPLSVIATGFPIRRRSDAETGLDIHLEVLLALGGIGTVTELDGGYVVKGRSIAFIPTQRFGDSVQWHFLRVPGKLTYKDIRRMPVFGTRLRFDVLGDEALHSTRTLVGWCHPTTNHLGTRSFDYTAVQPPTNLQSTSRNVLSLTGGSIGFSKIVTGSLQFSIGSKDGIYHSQRPEYYEELLDYARQLDVILYDTTQRRAYHADGERFILNVISHRHTTNSSSSKSLSPLKHAQGDDLTSVRSAMLMNRDLVLRTDQHLREKATKSKSFLGEVRELYEKLEGLQDQFEEITAAGVTLKMSWSESIQGWNYMEVVHPQRRMEIKEVVLAKSCGKWPEFARQISAIVVFANHFNSIIEPSHQNGLCHAFRTLPQDHDLLAVQVPSLKLRLQKNEGLITSGLQWNHSGDPFAPCSSSGTRINCACSRIQELARKHKDRKLEHSIIEGLPASGAVIFGQSSTRLIKIGTTWRQDASSSSHNTRQRHPSNRECSSGGQPEENLGDKQPPSTTAGGCNSTSSPCNNEQELGDFDMLNGLELTGSLVTKGQFQEAPSQAGYHPASETSASSFANFTPFSNDTSHIVSSISDTFDEDGTDDIMSDLTDVPPNAGSSNFNPVSLLNQTCVQQDVLCDSSDSRGISSSPLLPRGGEGPVHPPKRTLRRKRPFYGTK